MKRLQSPCMVTSIVQTTPVYSAENPSMGKMAKNKSRGHRNGRTKKIEGFPSCVAVVVFHNRERLFFLCVRNYNLLIYLSEGNEQNKANFRFTFTRSLF
jgi:hypothetical protein